MATTAPAPAVGASARVRRSGAPRQDASSGTHRSASSAAARAAAPRPSATVTSSGPQAAGARAFSTGANECAVTTRKVGQAPPDTGGVLYTVVSTTADEPTSTSAATAGSHRHRE